jgi:L-phenylalanine/L-methionine N-acetyltransferase
MISLRHAVPDDYLAIARIYNHQRAVAGTMQSPLQSPEVWKKRVADLPAHDRLLVALQDDDLVGSAGLHSNLNPRRSHAAMLGIAVRDDAQGQGVGHALMTAIIDLADNWLRLLRLELTVYADNASAQRLYQRHGFVPEGVLRAYSFRDGQYVDVLSMARLHPAPPSLG